jgi:holo-[acyl-carrier protein] synthase
MLGCDIIEIKRIKQSIEKFGEKFVNRILTEKEKEIYNKRSNKAEFLAGRFAAKESIVKSLKTGIGKTEFRDIEILNDINGAPFVIFLNENTHEIEISISHSKEYAMAVSIIKN